MPGLALLGGLTAERFLSRHWQRRPLLVRGALPGFADPLTPEELAGLACEPGLESRLVMERGGDHPWQLVRGPQEPKRLRALPPSHWTLLVQEVDRVEPAVAALRDRFSFLPRWRVDDVMISFAPRGGSVGPHVDSYDVFLVQGRGRRRWRIASGGDRTMRPGLDLRILRRFEAEQEWVLEAGDLLYLPPGVAHHGVALEDCLTYSVGFRAPSHADLLTCGLQAARASGAAERLYRDGTLDPSVGSEIDAATLTRFRHKAAATLKEADDDVFARFAGELLTQPGNVAPVAPARRTTTAAVAIRLRDGWKLAAALTARLAWSKTRTGALLFADGRAFTCEGARAGLARLLAAGHPAGAEELRPWERDASARALLVELLDEGVLRWTRPRNRRAAGTRPRSASR